MRPSTLLLNSKLYSYERIKTGDYQTDNSFEERTLLFCNQWLNGNLKFEQKTSGSTGKPKLIKVTRAQMLISAKHTATALHLKANDVALVCVDSAYIAGKMMLVRAFECNMQIVVVEPSLNPLKHKNKPFHFAAMVPLQIENILNDTTTKNKLTKCKAILIGGAPVNARLANQISQLKIPIYATYGMTETVSHIALQRLSSPAEICFTTVGDVNITVNNKEQLIINGAITNNQELLTNDRVQLLSPTTFKWLGRIDNVINSGGIKIQLEDVEKLISLVFNDLKINNRFFIIKTADESLGDKIVLYIEGSSKSFPENLSEILKNNLGKYQHPREIIFAKKFIETGSGKVNKLATIAI